MYSPATHTATSGTDLGAGWGEHLKKIQVKVKLLIRLGNLSEFVQILHNLHSYKSADSISGYELHVLYMYKENFGEFLYKKKLL